MLYEGRTVHMHHRVSVLDKEIDELHQERGHLLRRWNETHSRVGQHIPSEVLSLIFQRACPPIAFESREFDASALSEKSHISGFHDTSNFEANGPYFPITLSAVSSHWRQVAQSTPELWTTIAIEVRERTATNHASLLSHYLENAKALPFSVELDLRREQQLKFITKPDTISVEDAMQPIQAVLFSQDYAHKISNLRLIAPPHSWVSLIPSSFGRLEDLSIGWSARICASAPVAGWLDFTNMHHLRRVRIAGEIWPILPSMQITKLDLSGLPGNLTILIISQCVNLKECRVYNPTFDRQGFAPPAEPFVLGQLEFLGWETFSDSSRENTIIFFTYIHLPRLKRFKWDTDVILNNPDFPANQTTIDFLSRLPPSMTDIEIGAWQLRFMSREMIQAIFRALPHVQHLTYTVGWFLRQFVEVLEAMLPPDVQPRQVEILPMLRTLTFKEINDGNGVPELPYYLAALVKRRRVDWDTPDLRIELDSELIWTKEDMCSGALRVLMNDGFKLEVWEKSRRVQYSWPLPQTERQWVSKVLC
ncbi:hypothetical protein P691DRAFT_425822 [Macrolepiota fuliginosa MF-IS2]|uniref:F-box domain-containing protein n=1 Tax=Macrolepiota fuliginosa MF-IS2 TaxID=1400762 RepID=A0A9P5X4U5_9AGAR|nr:hypothetical protein P691DRAFT_425822 [Macrolepiota fuliginosa MF-IS2]